MVSPTTAWRCRRLPRRRVRQPPAIACVRWPVAGRRRRWRCRRVGSRRRGQRRPDPLRLATRDWRHRPTTGRAPTIAPIAAFTRALRDGLAASVLPGRRAAGLGPPERTAPARPGCRVPRRRRRPTTGSHAHRPDAGDGPRPAWPRRWRDRARPPALESLVCRCGSGPRPGRPRCHRGRRRRTSPAGRVVRPGARQIGVGDPPEPRRQRRLLELGGRAIVDHQPAEQPGHLPVLPARPRRSVRAGRQQPRAVASGRRGGRAGGRCTARDRRAASRRAGRSAGPRSPGPGASLAFAEQMVDDRSTRVDRPPHLVPIAPPCGPWTGSVDARSSAPLVGGEEDVLLSRRSDRSDPDLPRARGGIDGPPDRPRSALRGPGRRPAAGAAARTATNDVRRRHCAVPHRASSSVVSAPAVPAPMRSSRLAARSGPPRAAASHASVRRSPCDRAGRPERAEGVDRVASAAGDGLVGRAGQMGRREPRRRGGEQSPRRPPARWRRGRSTSRPGRRRGDRGSAAPDRRLRRRPPAARASARV